MLNGGNKPWEQTRKASGSMTSQVKLIKAHVLNCLADAADPLVQVMVDNGTGLKECDSATFGMLLQVGLQLLKRFGQMQGDGDPGETIRDPAPVPAGAPHDERLLCTSNKSGTAQAVRSLPPNPPSPNITQTNNRTLTHSAR
jgi:hypothetical protein